MAILPPDSVAAAQFATLFAQLDGKIPQGAQLLELRKILEDIVGKDDACLIATYIGTGRKESNEELAEVVQTAEEDCGTAGWLFDDRTVEEAMAAAKENVPHEMWLALAAWAGGKEIKALKSAKKSYDEETQKVIDKVEEVVEEAAAGAAFGLTAGLAVKLAVGAIVSKLLKLW